MLRWLLFGTHTGLKQSRRPSIVPARSTRLVLLVPHAPLIVAPDTPDALKWAGRYPDPALIEECLRRPDALTDALLDIVADPEVDTYWQDDAPRWYEPIHAAKLLLAYREPDALPLFEDLLRDPHGEIPLEWCDTDLQAFGPLAVDTYLDVATDDDAPSYGRNLAISALRQIADEHPDEAHNQVVTTLRAELPSVNDDGKLQIDAEPSYDEIEHGTEVALALAEVQDEQTRPIVEALFDEELIDEFIFGGARTTTRFWRATIPRSTTTSTSWSSTSAAPRRSAGSPPGPTSSHRRFSKRRTCWSTPWCTPGAIRIQT